jgi:cell division protein FtsN
MAFGLALGLLVAAVVYVRGNRDAGSPAPARAAVTLPLSAPEAVSQEPQAAAPAPVSRFDFYEVLPQYEVVIPEIESAPRVDRAVQPVEQPGRYVLQAGSFKRIGDADRRQASLALLGIESRIQRVTIDDDEFHRVRIGPIDELDELNRIRGRLRDARIETLLMRVPE